MLQHTAAPLTVEAAAGLARYYYGVTATATPLPGERDQNFRLTGADGNSYVLKLTPLGEDPDVLAAQNALLHVLRGAARSYRFPRAAAALDGTELVEVVGPNGPQWARLVEYVPGEPLARVRPHAPELLRAVGELFGTVDRVLRGFDHPALHRDFYWDLRHGCTVVTENLALVRDHSRRARIETLLPLLESVAALDRKLRRSVIHNDGNDHNLMVEVPDRTAPFDPVRLVGLLDFGDVVHTWTVAEVAIAATYVMLGKRDPLAAAAEVVAGYHDEYPLTEPDIEALYPLVCTRLAMSVTIAAAQRLRQPDNEYLSISEAPAWALLDRLAAVPPAFAHYRLRAACGLEPCPASGRVQKWLRAQDAPAPVLSGHDLAHAPVFDFSVGSLEFGDVADTSDPELWTHAVFGRMHAAGASAGLGRYDEPRPWYTAGVFRGESDGPPDWRTIHLGVDIFAEPGTGVCAPFDGTVHSAHDNVGHLDYGPTIILRHEIEPGLAFYTLYGHLSRDSLARLRPGDVVARGQRIASIGDATVNGGWSPHLHFQIMVDLLGRTCEFPGVGRPSERPVWRSLSPDPNLVLRLPQLSPAPQRPPESILAERRDRIGSSLSIAYRRPLVLVRGARQFVYDHNGQPYLDAVNNVAHVGHSHPRVVEALRSQAILLNTNTRYLHENLTRYAARLTATLPDPLRVCFFVCSGSEANELALRLARSHTRARDVVVIDGAYHGNTTALIELSPYKFNGPGGPGQADHVQVVPLPDPYRGLYRGSQRSVGSQYADHVRLAIERIRARGQDLAAFFAEPLLGCGGQIVPPDGYLTDAFAHVRATGGVCIADEVQTGLGRVGSHFWAFETQGVVPDIVTVGKPIGNGHPLGAVITTPEIAASFANGMEYFNTFGGNPVSCAVGMAVLDVIEQEELQQNAANVGPYLLQRLEELKQRHDIIGDVRGRGLYIGVELVLHREQRTPAGAAASYVANRMRERGVLLSTDGPDHNVLKIKPPLVFTRHDADMLADTLDEVLAESVLVK